MDEKQKKQLMIGGGVFGGVVLIAAIYFLFLKPSDDTTPDIATPGKPAGIRPDRQSNGIPTVAQSVNRGAAATPDVPGKSPASKQVAVLADRRKDPFYYEPHFIPPPPNVFTNVEPLTLARENYPKEAKKPPVVRVVPNRRVSGMMSGDGVYAILESTNGEVEIVKPGSRTKDGYTVAAINPDSVLLEKEDPTTHTTYTQTVLFTDTPVSSSMQGGGAGGRGPGGPGGNAGGRGLGGRGGGTPAPPPVDDGG